MVLIVYIYLDVSVSRVSELQKADGTDQSPNLSKYQNNPVRCLEVAFFPFLHARRFDLQWNQVVAMLPYQLI